MVLYLFSIVFDHHIASLLLVLQAFNVSPLVLGIDDPVDDLKIHIGPDRFNRNRRAER